MVLKWFLKGKAFAVWDLIGSTMTTNELIRCDVSQSPVPLLHVLTPSAERLAAFSDWLTSQVTVL